MNIYSKPEGQSTTCLHVGECKGQGISLFFNNIYPSLGQAKLELLKNHELARGYLFRDCGLLMFCPTVSGLMVFLRQPPCKPPNQRVVVTGIIVVKPGGVKSLPGKLFGRVHETSPGCAERKNGNRAVQCARGSGHHGGTAQTVLMNYFDVPPVL